MEQLHQQFNASWESGQIEPLILIPTYVLDFLCIHPFRDGNGRMARLLTLLLLYRAGYEVGRYISLEEMVERTRESYYDALLQSSRGWHQSKHDPRPWWEYFLGVVLLGSYQEFEHRVGSVTEPRGAKRQMVFNFVTRQIREFKYADVERACPGVSRPTINRALSELRRRGVIRCLVTGRNALWEKT